MPRHFSTHRTVCWRLTRRCNRRCEFCLSTSGPEIQDPKRNPLRTLDRLKELGVEKLSYSGGEPTLYPLFGQVLEYGQWLGIRQVLTTNGDVLSRRSVSWLGQLEHIKLSFYGDRRLHDELMGQGHFDSQMALVDDLALTHGMIVSANYMLTPESVETASAFLKVITETQLNYLSFQTYIQNRRLRIDERFRLDRPERALARLKAIVECAPSGIPGGITLQDYSTQDWFIVLTDEDILTLPAGNGGSDIVMGHVEADSLTLPNGQTRNARAAMEAIWSERYVTSAISVLREGEPEEVA